MAVNPTASGGTPEITGAIRPAAQCAAAMFPHAAAANHSIFYDASGRAWSVCEVYGS
jgi:hypothetical protein